jgi:hypothetical protein
MEEIGKSLPAIFSRQLRRGGPQLAEILAPLWARATGRAIAEHSRPVAFTAGTLTLETHCRTWAAQLLQMQAQIAEKVNAFLGAPVVKELRVRVAANARAWDAAAQPKLRVPESAEPLTAECDPGSGAEAETSRILARSYAKYFARNGRRTA